LPRNSISSASCSEMPVARDHRAAQVNREQQVHLLQVGERRPGSGQDVSTGIVDPCVDAAERPTHGRAERLQRLFIGDVDLKRGRTFPRGVNLRFRHTRTSRVRLVGERDIGARLGGAHSNRPANAARCPGHQDDATGQRRGKRL